MKFKFVGGSLSALLLAAALAGCTGGSGGSTAGGDGTLTSVSESDVLATVDGTSVTRKELDQTLEGLYGERFLSQVIDGQVLAAELKKKNITLTDDEINKEQARVAEQDPTVKAAIEAGGSRIYVVRNQVIRNLSLRQLLIADKKGDPAKEKAFFDKYASFYGTPAQNKLAILAATTKVRADQLNRALKAKPDSFAQLVTDQKARATTDPIAQQSTTDTGRFETPEEFATSRGIPPQLVAPIITALAKAKKGETLPANTQAITPNGPFLIIKVIDHKDAVKPSYDAVKAQVATDYRMSQVAEEEIKKNPANPTSLEENIRRVIQALGQPNQETGSPGIKASITDALAIILTPASTAYLQKLRPTANVQISDQSYKEVAQLYQQPTAVPGAPTGNSAAESNTATGNSTATNSAANTATANTAANSATTNSAAPSTP